MASMNGDDVQIPESGRRYSSYGRACLQCTKSKTRCAPSNDGGKCERCFRLNKDCSPAPKARISKGKSSSSVALVAKQTAALEKKIDDIVQLLQAGQAVSSHTATPASLETGSSSSQSNLEGQIAHHTKKTDTDRVVVPSEAFVLLLQAAQAGNLEQLNCHGLVSSTSTTPETSPDSESMAAAEELTAYKTTPNSSVSDHPEETVEELHEILDTFRTKMMPFFPVVIITPETTVDELSAQRPFLWLVLRALCGKNVGRQRALGREIRTTIGREMLFEGTKNMDILLGLIIYASWGHVFVTHKPIISPIIHLAISLASDLGLTRPVPPEPGAVMLNYTASGCPKPPHALRVVPRTIEERRTILGLFLISSVASIFFQRIEPLKWTPYLNECLSMLSKKREYPTDELLVYQIRVQLICNEVAAVSWNETFPTNNAGHRYPRGYYAHVFKNQLDDLKRSIPVELQNNTILQININGVELSILEHNLITSPHKDVTNDPASQVRRMEELWACFMTTKTLFDTFFDQNLFPSSSYPHISMAVYTLVAHGLVALFRLSTFDSPDIPWDRQRVVQELDLGIVVKKWVELWDSAPAVAGIDTSTAPEGESHWEYTTKALTLISNWWEGKIAPKLRAERQNGVLGGQDSIDSNGFLYADVSVPSDPIDLTGANFGILDDEWMKDVLGGGFEYFKEPYF